MNNIVFRITITTGILLLTIVNFGVCHEFIVKTSGSVSNGIDVVPVEVISAHVFMKSEEIEPLSAVETYVISEGKRQEISLQESPEEQILKGTYSAPSKNHILCGHRKGMIWSKTTQGWKLGSKKDLPGVVTSGLYEKFSKAVIRGNTADSSYMQPVGHLLEIVPLQDLTSIQPGNEVQFKVLYNGQPLATEVYATYDGFSTRSNTYSYYSNSDENGETAVKITSSGTWMVRVQHEIPEVTADYDKKVLRAVFLFEIAG